MHLLRRTSCGDLVRFACKVRLATKSRSAPYPSSIPPPRLGRKQVILAFHPTCFFFYVYVGAAPFGFKGAVFIIFNKVRLHPRSRFLVFPVHAPKACTNPPLTTKRGAPSTDPPPIVPCWPRPAPRGLALMLAPGFSPASVSLRFREPCTPLARAPFRLRGPSHEKTAPLKPQGAAPRGMRPD